MEPAANFSFFTVGGDLEVQNLKIDERGEPLRKRQEHRKSRNGCGNCKRRKVKCDETRPACQNCRKRGLECNALANGSRHGRSPRDGVRRERGEKEDRPKMKDASSQCEILPGTSSTSSVPTTTGIQSDSVPETATSTTLPTTDGFQLQEPFLGMYLQARRSNCEDSPVLDFASRRSYLSSEVYKWPAQQRYPLPPLPNVSSYPQSMMWWAADFWPQPNASFGSDLFPQDPNYWNLTNSDNENDSPNSTTSSGVDLILRRSIAERELILHFQMFTSKALCLSTTLWESDVLTAALNHDYLMSAIMLMAAAHINHYLPIDDPQRRPVLHHFGRAISGLRNALAEELTTTSFDNIISTSLLLMLYSWAYVEVSFGEKSDIADLFTETVTLFMTLIDCVVSGHILLSRTRWKHVLAYSPKIALAEYIRVNRPPGDTYYQKINHLMLCGVGTSDPECCSPDNMNAMGRLSLVLSAIHIAIPNIQDSGITDDIYRYLVTWPPFCTKGFIEQVRQNNLGSLCILLYYYAAIVRVENDRIWWMRDRALFMFTMLRRRLEGRCDFCVGPAIEMAGEIEETRYLEIEQRRGCY